MRKGVEETVRIQACSPSLASDIAETLCLEKHGIVARPEC